MFNLSSNSSTSKNNTAVSHAFYSLNFPTFGCGQKIIERQVSENS